MSNHRKTKASTASLLALHKAQHAEWMACPPDDDAKSSPLLDIACATWWKLLKAEPASLADAVSLARWGLYLDLESLAPDADPVTGKEINVPGHILRKLLSFLDASSADPAIIVAERVRAAWHAWNSYPCVEVRRSAEKQAEFDALEDAFFRAFDGLSKTKPRTFQGALAVIHVVIEMMNIDDGSIIALGVGCPVIAAAVACLGTPVQSNLSSPMAIAAE